MRPKIQEIIDCGTQGTLDNLPCRQSGADDIVLPKVPCVERERLESVLIRFARCWLPQIMILQAGHVST